MDGATAGLVLAGLSGPCDGRGNALFLRELVLHGLAQGSLADEGAVWRWRRPARRGRCVTDLVAPGP